MACRCSLLPPAGSFETQSPLAVGDARIQVAQAAKAGAGHPSCQAHGGLSDLPYLEQIPRPRRRTAASPHRRGAHWLPVA